MCSKRHKSVRQLHKRMFDLNLHTVATELATNLQTPLTLHLPDRLPILLLATTRGTARCTPDPPTGRNFFVFQLAPLPPPRVPVRFINRPPKPTSTPSPASPPETLDGVGILTAPNLVTGNCIGILGVAFTVLETTMSGGARTRLRRCERDEGAGPRRGGGGRGCG